MNKYSTSHNVTLQTEVTKMSTKQLTANIRSQSLNSFDVDKKLWRIFSKYIPHLELGNESDWRYQSRSDLNTPARRSNISGENPTV